MVPGAVLGSGGKYRLFSKHRHCLTLKEERGPRAASRAGNLLEAWGAEERPARRSGSLVGYLILVLYEHKEETCSNYPQAAPEWHRGLLLLSL